ncbi:similar to proprotein convertase subtilisin/kexin type 9 preproprotein [Rhizoctonia solani AG-1 IB]|uniref:Similar to proprotein convertase subtilisin/kexin type 9 preproprotein n=1 Tax=Thanatephorus cucumeris (strain AG1-IB / isolate 7/3/14) TaxID=1108050 RepID=M5C6U7_THACB|nr:similar to proprotein convertase subtilisin/kexin type 9 preproprotein [Rhizoctonia solani AG-1 IB]
MHPVLLTSILSIISTSLAAPTTNIPIIKHAGSIRLNSYIIKLKDNVSQELHFDDLFSSGTHPSITYKYKDAFHGYAAKFQSEELRYIRQSSDVEYIVEDGIIALDYDVIESTSEPNMKANFEDQMYISTHIGGAGVDIYGLDTGIQINHTSFGGRARWGATFGGYDDVDRNGHGTHTAATAVGDSFGVATSSHIIAVKVLGDSAIGQWSDVIAGIDFVITQAAQSGRPTIATLSLTGFTYTPVDIAVANAISKGVHFTVAAGNWGVDASGSSPAHVEEANTIGAVDSNKVRAGFSNFGASIDVWALGVNVTSAWVGPAGTETRVLSGTSMAT